MNDHADIMKLLLECDNPPDVNGGDEGKPLHFAALRGRLVAAKFLLEKYLSLSSLKAPPALSITGFLISYFPQRSRHRGSRRG